MQYRANTLPEEPQDCERNVRNYLSGVATQACKAARCHCIVACLQACHNSSHAYRLRGHTTETSKPTLIQPRDIDRGTRVLPLCLTVWARLPPHTALLATWSFLGRSGGCGVCRLLDRPRETTRLIAIVSPHGPSLPLLKCSNKGTGHMRLRAYVTILPTAPCDG